MRKNQGFSLIEVLIVIVVLVIIGALGVVGYNAWKKNDSMQANTSTPTKTVSAQAPDVKTTSDLDKATKTLDDTNLNSADSDAQQLSSQASGF